MVNEEAIKKAVLSIIQAIGEDPKREGLLETPRRVAEMYSELFAGMDMDPHEELQVGYELGHREMVVLRDIPFYSMCEHHFLPFYGKVHIAYIPNGKVAGLSKLARTVDVYAKRPQLQERMTSDIAEALRKYLDAQGVMVIVEAEHLCMNMRGIKKPGSKTKTMTVRGIFEENQSLREEALELMRD